MKRLYPLLALTLFLTVFACKSDDDDGITAVPPRDRGEQAIVDDALIMEYFETHFYNYEDFEQNAPGFDNQIVIDTIAGDNADKRTLKEELENGKIRVKSLEREGQVQNLYILDAKIGGDGTNSIEPEYTVKFADSVLVRYKGNVLGSTEVFDGSNNPVWFDLPTTSLPTNVFGFSHGLADTKSATGFSQNPDGTLDFGDDFSSIAVFIPSGFAYYNSPPSSSGIEQYDNLVFTMSTFMRVDTDHDGDFIPSYLEDLNGNDFLFDQNEDGDDGDNTDGDSAFNYFDSDDDNDGVPTRNELVGIDTNDDGVVDSAQAYDPNDPSTLRDTDGDGILDHLDNDDDGDGKLTIEEVRFIGANNNILTFPDSDGDGVPDFLDADS